MKRGIATIVNNVPILLTDSDSEDELFSTNENTVKIDRWTAPQSISDISDHTLPIGDNRDNRQDPRFSPLDVEPVEPIINSQIQSSWDQSFVAQINFQERPPEIPPLLRKNTKNNPRISHYQNAPQPHSSSPARAPQDSYRNHRLRKEQAQRLANSRKKSNETESSVNVHRSNEPSISVTPSATLLSNYQENLIAINKEIIINEPVVAAMPLQHLDINDNFFEVEILKKLDDQYNINHKKIKMEVGFEIVLPEEVNIKTEYSEEIINYEPPIDIKSEPVTYFSDVDENTSEFKYNYTAEVVAENVKGSLSEQLRNYTEHRCFKEEPLDI